MGGIDAALHGYHMHCLDCKTQNDVLPVLNSVGGHVFICGSCLYRRDHPDAAPAVEMPRDRRALPLQHETLF
jgi:hypothetical protein